MAVRRCLELAHASLAAGGLPCGTVVLDAGGSVIAEGRNRAYDPAGGTDPLQGTPIAHAEMNALAGVPTACDLSSTTLWSSHRPCSMCAAACEFVGVGAVRFVAPDPSDPDTSDPADVDHAWAVVANLLFLQGVLDYSGAGSPTFARARVSEPEVSALLPQAELPGAPLAEWLAEHWVLISEAALRRGARHT